MSKRIPELYGSMIFSDRIMRNKLPKDVYKALRKTIEIPPFTDGESSRYDVGTVCTGLHQRTLRKYWN